jgi:tripartite-type tricarboxylate transporter receptor subunit TctC
MTALVLLAGITSLHAQDSDFPKGPIELVVPFAPGGTADLAARIVADQLSKELKVSVVVVNKEGASGSPGTQSVAKAKPDGYTLLTGNAASLVNSYFFLSSVPFDAHKDFVPLAYVGESPSLVVVLESSPYKTLEDVIDYAKKNPGKLSYAAGGGISAVSTLNMEVIKNKTGADIAMVIYEGGAPALTSVLGGHVTMTAAGFPTLGPHIKAGKLRALVTTLKIPEMPDLRGYKEAGFPEVLLNWTGFFAPSKIPPAVNKKLVEAFDRALKNPEAIDKLRKTGYVPEIKTPAEITEMMKQQYQLVSRVVKEAKLVK